jgi:hypothetical protein
MVTPTSAVGWNGRARSGAVSFDGFWSRVDGA